MDERDEEVSTIWGHLNAAENSFWNQLGATVSNSKDEEVEREWSTAKGTVRRESRQSDQPPAKKPPTLVIVILVGSNFFSCLICVCRDCESVVPNPAYFFEFHFSDF